MVQRVWLTDGPRSFSSIEKVAEIAPAMEIEAAPVPIRYMNLETLAEPHLRFLFEQTIQTREPAVEVFRLEDAIVLSSGVIASVDGYVLNDSFGPYHRPENLNDEFGSPDSDTPTRILPQGDARLGFRTIERRERAYFNLRDHGEFGYFHFMNAVMPAALVWKDGFSKMPCYYATGSDFQKGYFDMLGVANTPGHMVSKGTSLFARELYVVAGTVRPDGYSGGFFERPRYVVERMRRLAAGIPRGSRRRVYISRRDATARQMSNEAELELMLENELGFAPVQTTGLTPAQQIELFKGCDAVIGLHGAGLSNIVFCAPGTQVIELFPPTRIWPTFRALANRCNHRYAAVVLESEQAVDVRQLHGLLSELL